MTRERFSLCWVLLIAYLCPANSNLSFHKSRHVLSEDSIETKSRITHQIFLSGDTHTNLAAIDANGNVMNGGWSQDSGTSAGINFKGDVEWYKHDTESFSETYSGSGSCQKFWIPPFHSQADQFNGLMDWRRHNIRFLRSHILVTMSPVSFILLIRREHRAADAFGNRDGCVSADEHPDFSIFAEHFSKKASRICASHLFHYARSSGFQRDMRSARQSHRSLLRMIKVSKQEVTTKVEDELTDLTNKPKDVPLFDFSKNTVEKVLRSQQNSGDLVAELKAEKETLDSESDSEYAASQFMIEKVDGGDDSFIRMENGSKHAAKAGVPEKHNALGKLGTFRRSGGTQAYKVDAAGNVGKQSNLVRRAGHEQKCLYNRHDVCDLQLKQVPMLGTHNSGAYPKLYLECEKKKQECVQWAIETREECNEQVYECKKWTNVVEKKCTSWVSKCKSWAKKRCGFLSFICGLFCSVFELVCAAFIWVTRAVCDAYGWVCKGFTYFVEYVGCNVYKWVCVAASEISLVGCLWENQNHGVLDQLERGVRYFDIDSCLVNQEEEVAMKPHSKSANASSEVVNHELRNCHGTNYELRAIGSSVDFDIGLISLWLQDHPTEVVVIGWSNTEHGKVGIDYPEDYDGDSYHVKLRREAIEKSFSMSKCFGDCAEEGYVGGPCGSADMVCYTDNLDLKLSVMIKNNVRLVVNVAKQLNTDSYSDDSASGSAEDIEEHLKTFCDQRAPGDNAMLSAFVSLTSRAAYGPSTKYQLECPNHCSEHVDDKPATCECNAGEAEMMEVQMPGGLIQGNSSGDEQIACNEWNANKINQNIVSKLQEIVTKCYANDAPVSTVLVDYVGKHNEGLQTAVALAIDKAVEKFR